MSKQKKISVNIAGDMSGQVVIGDNNQVIKSIAHLPDNSEKVEELRRLLDELKIRIQMELQEGNREDALKKVDELEYAILETKPDLATIEYVKQWFAKKSPSLAEVIAGITGKFLNHTL